MNPLRSAYSNNYYFVTNSFFRTIYVQCGTPFHVQLLLQPNHYSVATCFFCTYVQCGTPFLATTSTSCSSRTQSSPLLAVQNEGVEAAEEKGRVATGGEVASESAGQGAGAGCGVAGAGREGQEREEREEGQMEGDSRKGNREVEFVTLQAS